MPKQLVLASASSARKELLERLGFSIKTSPGNVDEEWLTGESPENYVKRIARAKVLNVVERLHQTLSPIPEPEKDKTKTMLKEHPLRWVVGAKTIIVYKNMVLGKPKDTNEATEMLMKLSGEEHQVITGFCLYDMKKNKEGIQCVVTNVKFKKLSKNEIEKYLSIGESMDRPGAYYVQGVGSYLVDSIVGSYTNIVGLPLCQLIEMMEEMGALDIIPY